MPKFTLYADAPADGGGTATADDTATETPPVADTPKPPVTPIAGAFIPTPKSQATPPTDQKPTSGFDWKGKLPDDAPAPFKKYKSWEEVGKAHGSLQAEMERLKKSKIEPLTTENWGTWFGEYLNTGSLPEATFQQIQAVTGLPPDMAADFFEFKKHQREEYIAKADIDLGGAVTYNQLEEWLSTPDSPFAPEEIAGFMAMSKRGDTAWLKLVAAEYAKKNPTSVQNAAPSVPPQSKAPARSGRPSGTGNTPGYKTRAEYQKDIADAGGDQVKIAAARAKLMKTPQQVVDSWGRAP